MNPSYLAWLGVLGFLVGMLAFHSLWLTVLSVLAVATGVIWALICLVLDLPGSSRMS